MEKFKKLWASDFTSERRLKSHERSLKKKQKENIKIFRRQRMLSARAKKALD